MWESGELKDAVESPERSLECQIGYTKLILIRKLTLSSDRDPTIKYIRFVSLLLDSLYSEKDCVVIASRNIMTSKER